MRPPRSSSVPNLDGFRIESPRVRVDFLRRSEIQFLGECGLNRIDFERVRPFGQAEIAGEFRVVERDADVLQIDRAPLRIEGRGYFAPRLC